MSSQENYFSVKRTRPNRSLVKKKKKKTVNLGDEKRALFTLGPRAQPLTAGEAGTPRGQATRGRCHRAGRSGPGAHSTATL